MTLNPRIVTAAREVLVAATGENKAAILRDILHGERDENRLPAQLARHDRATWILDEAAASSLDR
jgi:6-phosphogluconolactonase/glucosamine-6-phosphate isomerase/deaminase